MAKRVKKRKKKKNWIVLVIILILLAFEGFLLIKYFNKTNTSIKISKIYINVENKGSTDTNYAGAFAGSGEGVLINVGGEE